jgi:hypothetical protein
LEGCDKVVGVTVLQLKPREESFYTILFEKLAKVDAIILCEGRSDVEVVKAVFKKLISTSGGLVIGFTDCEGVENVEYMAKIIARLVKLFRKLKSIVLIVDADEYSAEARARSVIDSLRSVGVVAEDLKPHSEQVFVVKTRSNDKTFELVIVISGDFTIPTKRHVLEDHCAKLMNIAIHSSTDSTKQLIKSIDDCLKHIDIAPKDSVINSFRHIYTALQLLLKM